MKKSRALFLSFLLPVLILLTFSAIFQYFPFGEYSMRIYDARLQYPGFFLALKNASFYSLGAGLGFNFFATAAYYLFSPFHLLIFFFRSVDFDIFYSILIYLKIGFAGLFMGIFLSHYREKNCSLSWLFSTIYAFCGFVSAYYYNVMWLDGVILLPLVMYGIKELVEKEKSTLYLIALTLSIITNFYIGYMICIFSVLYFVFLLWNRDTDRKKKIAQKFFLVSLFAGGISAIVLLPTILALLGGKATGFSDSYTTYLGFHDSIQYFFYDLTPGAFARNDHVSGPALIYFSIFAVVLVVLLFFSNKYSTKYKISVLLVLLFYIVSFSFNGLDYAWQMFQRPVWWPSRYAFTFSAFFLVLAYDVYLHREDLQIVLSARKWIALAISSLFLGSFILKFFSLDQQDISSICFILVSILLVFFYIFSFDRKKLQGFCVLLVLVELSLNLFHNLQMTIDKSSPLSNQLYYKQVAESIEAVQQLDSSSYRMELTGNYIYNDGLLFGYQGINYFNSVRNQKFVHFAEYVAGLRVGSHCSVILDRFDPFLLSLFHIKYLVGDPIGNWEQATDFSGLSAYQNPYPLSYGFLIDPEDKKISFEEGRYVDNLRKIANAIGAKENLYRPLEELSPTINYENVEKKEKYNLFQIKDNEKDAIITYSLIAKNDFYLIPTDFSGFKENADIFINDSIVNLNVMYPYVKKGDKVRIDFHLKFDMIISDIQLYAFDVPLYEDTLSSLTLFEIDENSNALLKGKISVEKEKQTLFLSLPYEKGFTILVDGKKKDYDIVWDTFVGIDLEKGEHEITINYIPDGLILGSVISLITICISCTYLYAERKKYAIIGIEGDL